MHRRLLMAAATATFMISQPVSAQSVQDTERFTPIAEALISQIPADGRYAIADITSNAQGLPDSYLAQLRADIEAALLVASGFKITLIDKAEMQGAWREAVEFNGANMENLADNSGFDAVISFNIRAIQDGFQITGQVIGAGETNAGQIIGSTPQFTIQADWQNQDGVQVVTDAEISAILEQIAKLERTGGLVENPQSFAEFYHNAETYHRQGDIDAAIKSYENAMSPEITFVDPVLDLASLATARYGTEGAEMFLQARMGDRLTPELMQVALMAIPGGETPIGLEEVLHTKIDHPVLYAQWLWGEGQKTRQEIEQGDEKDFEKVYALLESSRRIMRSYRSGEFQKHFVDKIEASAIAKVEDAQALEARHNIAEYTLGTRYFHLEKDLEIEVNHAEWRPETFQGELINLRGDTLGNLPCGSYHDNASYEVTHTPTLSLSDFDSSMGMPLQTGNDRVVFGRKCAEFALQTEYQSPIKAFKDTDGRWMASVIGELFIRDDVDPGKPIMVQISPYEAIGGDIEFPDATMDITKDGTVFVSDGAPIRLSYIPEMYDLQPHDNDWLFAPGIVQSSLGYSRIAEITYTTIYGETKTISKFEVHEADQGIPGNTSLAKSLYFSMESPDLFREMEQHVIEAAYSGIEEAPKASHNPLDGCLVTVPQAKITNVNEFVNVRQEPGFNSSIVGKAALNEDVTVMRPIPWLFGDERSNLYCKDLCEAQIDQGLDQNLKKALSQCIENNNLWFEIQTGQSVGYVSGKFLAPIY